MGFCKYGSVAVIGTVLSIICTNVHAGGFAIREQSTVGLGSAFAGMGAGGSLGSMYWNGATITEMEGMNTESANFLIVPNAELTSANNSAEVGMNALVGSSFLSYQISDQLFFGMGLNAPIGLTTKPDNFNWDGATRGLTSKVFSLNANPTVAYKYSDMLSVSAGLQVQYTEVTLRSAHPVQGQVSINGDDIGFGYTLGVSLKPTSTTTVGVGYRSAIAHTLEGDLSGLLPSPTFDVSAKLRTPDMLTVGLRQELSQSTRLLGTFEWAKWSNLERLSVVSKASGDEVVGEDYNWKDSWFASVGMEHDISNQITMRGGLAYEKTPVPDATRSVRLPDSNRIWAGIGLSYKWSDKTTVDLAYSHIFMKESKIDLEGDLARGLIPLKADVDSHLDIFSVGFRHKF